MVKSTRTNDDASRKSRRLESLGLIFRNGWYVLPSRGRVVTSELIEKIQEELDREDALRAAHPLDAEE
jgi:hypothetical protein